MYGLSNRCRRVAYCVSPEEEWAGGEEEWREERDFRMWRKWWIKRHSADFEVPDWSRPAHWPCGIHFGYIQFNKIYEYPISASRHYISTGQISWNPHLRRLLQKPLCRKVSARIHRRGCGEGEQVLLFAYGCRNKRHFKINQISVI